LVEHNVLVVSGLAYGIDQAAHQACVQHHVATVGVLAHGLDRIYPPSHEKLAKNMLENGGLLSEFTSGTIPDRTNFPQRNRIIAGISDATIVVETAPKGGSIITALLANSYQRDVFAYPGRTTDKYSTGCNLLIKSNQAILIESADDIANHLNWKADPKKPAHIQKQLFVELEPDEEIIINALQNATSNGLHIDQLSRQSQLGPSATATALLMLEFKGLVRALVGNVYKLS
jgi:DNA processing protein